MNRSMDKQASKKHKHECACFITCVHDNAMCMHVCAQMFMEKCFRVPEMEYCASASRMLAEEIWQISEGFVEVSANL